MIQSSAPTRIDLAGGTLDIWPLYITLGFPPTLNAAIDLYAQVTLKPRRDRKVVVESRDLNLRETFTSIDSLPDRHPLELILLALQFYRPPKGLEIVTECQAPPGSGIGGSSALNIALQGALNRFTGNRYKKKDLVPIAKNIETQVLRTPTGWQDYFPALQGGVLSIQGSTLGMQAESLPVAPESLNDRVVLCYTGIPHHSGINNWEVLKSALDGDKKVLRHLDAIKEATLGMETALRAGRLNEMAGWLGDEWKARKKLAPLICPPQMEVLIRSAKRAGAQAAKACGAGGGGCVMLWVEEGKKEKVADTLKQNGGRVLPFRFVSRGLKVKSSG